MKGHILGELCISLLHVSNLMCWPRAQRVTRQKHCALLLFERSVIFLITMKNRGKRRHNVRSPTDHKAPCKHWPICATLRNAFRSEKLLLAEERCCTGLLCNPICSSFQLKKPQGLEGLVILTQESHSPLYSAVASPYASNNTTSTFKMLAPACFSNKNACTLDSGYTTAQHLISMRS